MSTLNIVLLVIALAMLAIVARRSRADAARGLSDAWSNARRMALLVPVAIISAGFLAQILPHDWIGATIGRDSGLLGILYGSVAGAFLPGGPMVAFPIALAFWQAGAGEAQLIALLTGWGVYAIHRMFVFEVPMLGFPFTRLRILSGLVLPPVAGVAAGGIWAVLPLA